MERPSLNPMFMHDAASPPSAIAHRSALSRFLRSALRIDRLLVVDIRFWKRDRLRIEDGSPWGRALRGIAYRLLLLPVMFAALVSALVWSGTHPPQSSLSADPLSLGIYYDPVNFASRDGTRLEGWLVPVIDARAVLEDRDRVIGRKHPAVILSHDFASDRSQMLPLVEPLRRAGFIVLVTSLRGMPGQARGVTFGVHEAQDIAAAFDLLSRRPDVDASRIAVLGIGSGATAAIIAHRRNPSIAALVLDHPLESADLTIARNIAPPQPWLEWMQPTLKWAFELGYQVDCEEIDLRERTRAAINGPVLMFGPNAAAGSVFNSRGIAQTMDFLSRHLAEKPPVASVR